MSSNNFRAVPIDRERCPWLILNGEYYYPIYDLIIDVFDATGDGNSSVAFANAIAIKFIDSLVGKFHHIVESSSEVRIYQTDE